MYGINKKIFVCNTKIIRDSHLKFTTFNYSSKLFNFSVIVSIWYNLVNSNIIHDLYYPEIQNCDCNTQDIHICWTYTYPSTLMLILLFM